MVIREKEVVPPHRPFWRDDSRRRSHGNGHGRVQGISRDLFESLYSQLTYVAPTDCSLWCCKTIAFPACRSCIASAEIECISVTLLHAGNF